MRSARLSRLKWGAWLGHLLVIGTLVVPSGLAFFAAVRAAAARDHVSATYTLQAARAERLRSLGLELGLNVRAVLIRSDTVVGASVAQARRDFDQAVIALRAAAGPEGRKQLAEIEQTAQEYEAAAERVLASPASRVSAFDDELAPLMKQIRERLDAYVAYKHDIAERAKVNADAKFKERSRSLPSRSFAPLGSAWCSRRCRRGDSIETPSASEKSPRARSGRWPRVMSSSRSWLTICEARSTRSR